MVKFIFYSFIFHLTLLAVFKLEIVDLKKNKEQAINVNLSIEKKTVIEKKKPKKESTPKKTVKEKEKPKKENRIIFKRPFISKSFIPFGNKNLNKPKKIRKI